ncbi:hypothetical protein SLEP1_g16939 [Rubroshorea leprosula]|uniref:Integrase catalytic domain-containing protein n=1 Tax=Rubroshorea leprosula TaxID=152421 RepID=A0AAV5ISI5_9ROSI|nr:hypothetical protein SLEP1_g16939 [Rubroshorea leprosula]
MRQQAKGIPCQIENHNALWLMWEAIQNHILQFYNNKSLPSRQIPKYHSTPN